MGITFTGKTIGAGGFAPIWKCEKRDRHNNVRQLACKKIGLCDCAIRGIPLDKVIQMMAREAESHKAIKHPNVVEKEFIYHVNDNITQFESPVILLIFMELCDGDLLSLTEKRRPFILKQAKKWFVQIANALSYLHSIGIAHRDLKTMNILYKNEKRDKTDFYCFEIADFGLSIIFTENTQPKTGSPFDRQMFIAPECDTRAKDYIKYNAFKADVYSLGICLLQCLVIEQDFYQHMANSVEKTLNDYQQSSLLKKFEIIIGSEMFHILQDLSVFGFDYCID